MTGHEFDVIAAFAIPAVLIGAGIRSRFLPDPSAVSNVNRTQRVPAAGPEPSLAVPPLPKRDPGAIYDEINDEFRRYRVWAG